MVHRPNQIAALRRGAGLTQEELARRVRVSVRAVAAWESGATVPRRANARRLAKSLGVTVWDLGIGNSKAVASGAA